ncbi:MAG: DUF1638 domain-containing protein, partial [Terrimicrobiaceae bacterium]|nr:DUF1638 domain-containing protein [Terrimicrobiaceae bacterium]
PPRNRAGGPGMSPRLAILACRVFELEFETHLRPLLKPPSQIEFFEIGLHDRPNQLRSTLSEAIARWDCRPDLDAIALLYGLCGLGTSGLKAGWLPLVIPRAHDCISVFLGSKERHAERQRNHPGTYHYTTGWNRARRVPGPEREAALRADLSNRFEPEDVEFLIEADREQWKAYDTACFIETGTPDTEEEAAYAQECARHLGWHFERVAGSTAILRDLVLGNWDSSRFQIGRPGEVLRHVPGPDIMGSGPA